MAAWAYPCKACRDGEVIWFVPAITVDLWPPEVKMVRVKVGSRWRCAQLDRSRKESVEGLLLREVVAVEGRTCADCVDG